MFSFSPAIKLKAKTVRIRAKIARFIINKGRYIINKGPFIYVYEWDAWDNYLFTLLFKSAIRIKAGIAQKNKYILNQVTRHNGYFLFHINLSETSRFFENKETLCERLKSRNIKYLNKDIVDISKKFVQDTCFLLGLNCTRAFPDGDPDELLIIKSNDNYGGIKENKLTADQKIKLGITITSSDQNVEYTVTERRNIEQNIWDDRSLVIERYISNTENLHYRVYKVNKRVVISEVNDDNLIKKMPDGIKRTNFCFDALADDLHGTERADMNELYFIINKFCSHVNLDFGAIDVVRDDNNQFYIIDINTTPFWGIKSHHEAGLFKFLSGALN